MCVGVCDDYRGCYVIGEKFVVTVFDVPVFDVDSPLQTKQLDTFHLK